MRTGDAAGLVVVQAARSDDARAGWVGDWVASTAWSHGGFRLQEAHPAGCAVGGTALAGRPAGWEKMVEHVAGADAVLVVMSPAGPARMRAMGALVDAVGSRWEGKPTGFVHGVGYSNGVPMQLIGRTRGHGARLPAPAGVCVPARDEGIQPCGCVRPDAAHACALRELLRWLRVEVGMQRHDWVGQMHRAVA